MASGLYVETFEAALKNDLALDMDNDTFKCMLTLVGYVPDFETDTNFSDVSNEATGTNYTAGGETMTSVAMTSSSDGTGTIKWDADDVSWANSTLTAVTGGVIYDDTVTNKRLIAYIDFGGSFSTTSGTFQIQWNASGIFTLDLKP
jgi:hypothetical protein|tara:strand:+ start:11682 stop:12119 length:438 start_codon:yes stop_codon:yes gene_type:complete